MGLRKMRKDVFEALTYNVKSSLPKDLLEIILMYAYDVRCGVASVQYFFWIPSKKCKNTAIARKFGRRGRR